MGRIDEARKQIKAIKEFFEKCARQEVGDSFDEELNNGTTIRITRIK